MTIISIVNSQKTETKSIFNEKVLKIETIFTNEETITNIIDFLSNDTYLINVKYKDDYLLFLVTSVKDDFPNVEIFTPDKISHLKKVYPNTRFYA